MDFIGVAIIIIVLTTHNTILALRVNKMDDKIDKIINKLNIE
jgi:hypothetical protein